MGRPWGGASILEKNPLRLVKTPPATVHRFLPAFTLIEVLVVVAIILVCAALVFLGLSQTRKMAAKAAEVATARELIVGFEATAVERNNVYLPGYDRRVDEVVLRGGRVVAGPTANRYPFRLAAAMNVAVEKIAHVGEIASQINTSNDYLVSLYPALGINYYFVGGDVHQDGSVSHRGECVTSPMQGAASIVVFASAGSLGDNGMISGYNTLTPPYLTTRMWTRETWGPDANPKDYGHIHARHGGKAVAAFLDGSVRLLTVEDLRDMRRWSVKAALEDNPKYTIKRATGGRL